MSRSAVGPFAPFEPFETFELERWFASQVGRQRIDLTSSSAPPRTLRDLLALASTDERDRFDAVSLGYGPPDGAGSLRAAIAVRSSSSRGEEITVTCGAIEALRLAIDAVVAEGDDVIVQEPMYGAVAGLARVRGAAVVPWPLRPEHGFVGSLDELEARIGPRTTLVAITQPNSPTGSVLDERELDALAGLLAPRGIWLLSDEVYRDLALAPGLVVPSAGGRYDRAVVVGDVAKPFGLGGLRIGWIVARDPEIRARIGAARDYTTLSPPTPSAALAEIALRHADELLARPLQDARVNLDRLRAAAGRRTALSLAPPRAGVTAFPSVSGAERIQRQLAERGVLVVPGSLFGQSDGLRIGLAGPPEEFSAGLAQLESLC
jgi:aspartate/methionine/tyrosine aminotransferase